MTDKFPSFATMWEQAGRGIIDDSSVAFPSYGKDRQQDKKLTPEREPRSKQASRVHAIRLSDGH